MSLRPQRDLPSESGGAGPLGRTAELVFVRGEPGRPAGLEPEEVRAEAAAGDAVGDVRLGAVGEAGGEAGRRERGVGRVFVETGELRRVVSDVCQVRSEAGSRGGLGKSPCGRAS